MFVFQVTWNFKIGTVGRIFLNFYILFKILHGNNRETGHVCQNGKIPRNLLKIFKKVRVSSH